MAIDQECCNRKEGRKRNTPPGVPRLTSLAEEGGRTGGFILLREALWREKHPRGVLEKRVSSRGRVVAIERDQWVTTALRYHPFSKGSSGTEDDRAEQAAR